MAATYTVWKARMVKPSGGKGSFRDPYVVDMVAEISGTPETVLFDAIKYMRSEGWELIGEIWCEEETESAEFDEPGFQDPWADGAGY